MIEILIVGYYPVGRDKDKLYFKGSRVVIDVKLKKYTFFENSFILGGKGTRMVNYNFVPQGIFMIDPLCLDSLNRQIWV